MKNLITFTLLILGSFQCALAQRKCSPPSYDLTLSYHGSSQKSQDHLNLGALKKIAPKKYAVLVRSFDTPVNDAGDHLIKAGNRIAWGIVMGTVGTILTTVGEPTSGLLITLAGVYLQFNGYGHLQKAGQRLKSAE